LIYKPHEYQEYSIKFIEEHPIAAIFLDCGLGKTSITLTALNNLLFDSFDSHKVLVVAPLRVTLVWKNEIAKWDHLSNLICSIVVGTEMERLEALNKKADIYVINRENLQWLVERSYVPFDFDTVVLDELSSFKNGKSKRVKALLEVRSKIKRIIGLTGTPTSNGLLDIWAQYRVLDCGIRLGRFITNYRNKYFTPDRRNGVIVYSYKPLPFAEEAIYDRIKDITISMKATDYLKMPELIEAEYKVYMSDEEYANYAELQNELVVSFGDEEEITATNAAVLSNKLCQMSNGAIYTDEHKVKKIHDAKLNALEDIIEAMQGRPLLVAYWFKHDLERIEERLNELKINYQCLTTESAINDWNKGKITVGLIHPASAGHGLNLQESGANTLVWFGLTWSLELYQQTNARLYRQGQKEKTVVIEHIINDGTIDEDILKALKKKDKTQASLIAAVKAHIGGKRR